MEEAKKKVPRMAMRQMELRAAEATPGDAEAEYRRKGCACAGEPRDEGREGESR